MEVGGVGGGIVNGRVVIIFQTSSYRALQIGSFILMEHYKMKKIILAILLIALAASTHCSCGSTGSSCCSGTSCNTGSPCPDPTFDVNSQVCVSPPSVQPPECIIPQVECPQTCPPPTEEPSINCPEIEVESREVPDVIEPPSIDVPDVVIPEPELCVITAPTGPVFEAPSIDDKPIFLPPPPPGPTPTVPLSNKFKLSFKYACRKNVPFHSCQALVIWNDVIVATIIPNDYAVHTYSVDVFVKGGENKLQIEGAGKSNSYGITIDNVRLVRYNTATNIVVNGGFEAPDVGYSWGIFNNIEGWEGVGIEVGWGKIYNGNWNSQVLELDGHMNYQITQRWSFDSQYKLVSQIPCNTNNFIGKFLTFKLEFDYAARQYGVNSPATSSANVLWNNVIVGAINPSNYDVHHAVFYVQLKAGNNFLQFDGAGPSDYLGLTIDNVKLTSKYNHYYNLIHNAGFENPQVNNVNNWVYTKGGIPHWHAQKAEHGKCSVYNSKWPACNGQCLELDSTNNQRYTQVVMISQFKFNQFLINKATIEGDASVQNHIDCSLNYIHHTASTACAQISYGIYLQISLTAEALDKYLCQLYQVSSAVVKNLKYDQYLVLSQFDCLSKAYVGKFGHSYEPDYDLSVFNPTNLHSWEGYIEAIHGKVIKCRDVHGGHHYVQIAPCTHYEGQFALPQIGHKIYWKGTKQHCGKTYVKWVTTCNC